MAGCPGPESATYSSDGDDRDDEGGEGDEDAEDRCEDYAERVYEDCVDAGGDEDDCGERSRAAYEECMDDVEDDEDADAAERCEDYAEVVYEDCVDAPFPKAVRSGCSSMTGKGRSFPWSGWTSRLPHRAHQ